MNLAKSPSVEQSERPCPGAYCLNGTAAAIVAGYSVKTARAIASQNLSNRAWDHAPKQLWVHSGRVSRVGPAMQTARSIDRQGAHGVHQRQRESADAQLRHLSNRFRPRDSLVKPFTPQRADQARCGFSASGLHPIAGQSMHAQSCNSAPMSSPVVPSNSALTPPLISFSTMRAS